MVIAGVLPRIRATGNSDGIRGRICSGKYQGCIDYEEVHQHFCSPCFKQLEQTACRSQASRDLLEAKYPRRE